MKKLLLVLIVMMVPFVIFAGGQGEEDADGAYRIAYIQPGSFAYYDNSSEGVKMACEILGYEVLLYNSDFKPEKEVANVEDALVQNVDGIVLFSISSDAASQVLKRANDAGVPVHMIYGYAPEFESKAIGFIQANGMDTGGKVGEWVATNVESGQVAVIQGQLGRGDAETYSKGFVEALSVNPKLEVVAQEPADWDPGKAYTVMENLITSYPDLRAVFVQNEPMAIAAYKALKVQGKEEQVKIVSQNGSPEGLDAVAKGQITATSGWSPARESQIALKRLIKVLDGGSLEEILVNTPVKVITKSNITEADPWIPTEASTKAVFDM